MNLFSENITPWQVNSYFRNSNATMKTPSDTFSISLHRSSNLFFIRLKVSPEFKAPREIHTPWAFLTAATMKAHLPVDNLIGLVDVLDWLVKHKKEEDRNKWKKKPWSHCSAACTWRLLPPTIVSHLKGHLQNLMRCLKKGQVQIANEPVWQRSGEKKKPFWT